MLNINMEYKFGILFVRLNGKLTLENAQKLESSLIPIIINNGIKNLVYNFNELKSIDEVGHKLLLMTINAVKHNKGNTLIVNNKSLGDKMKLDVNEIINDENIKYLIKSIANKFYGAEKKDLYQVGYLTILKIIIPLK